MTAPSYTAPAGVAGYCGRCGTPIAEGGGQFCRNCGNRVRTQPPVATRYSYPAVPATSVPAAQHRLGHTGFLLAALGLLAVLVAVITAVAVSQKPTVSYCHFTCGPDVGPRLLGHNVYDNSQFGYKIEYEKPPFAIAGQTANGVDLEGSQDNFVLFYGNTGTNAQTAIQKSISGLSTTEFQDLQQISSVVPGAEIGFVPGSGAAYTANFVPPGGGQQEPVSVLVMAATQGNLTITVLVVGSQDTSTVSDMPFGFQFGSFFDFEVSNTIWPGQS